MVYSGKTAAKKTLSAIASPVKGTINSLLARPQTLRMAGLSLGLAAGITSVVLVGLGLASIYSINPTGQSQVLSLAGVILAAIAVLIGLLSFWRARRWLFVIAGLCALAAAVLVSIGLTEDGTLPNSSYGAASGALLAFTALLFGLVISTIPKTVGRA